MNNLFSQLESLEPSTPDDTKVRNDGDLFSQLEQLDSPKAPKAPEAPTDPVEGYKQMLATPRDRQTLERLAKVQGTSVTDPKFIERYTQPMGFRTYTTLSQLATTGDESEADDIGDDGKPKGLGLTAALQEFGVAGGVFRRRRDAIISRIAAGQKLELTKIQPGAHAVMGGPGLPPTMKVYKQIENMTRSEQDATVPREVLDVVNQNENPDHPYDAKTRGEMISYVAKTGAKYRAGVQQNASDELNIRERLTGKSDGALNTLGTLAAKGLPSVGYGNAYLVGAGLAGPIGISEELGSMLLATGVSGMSKTTELLKADIDPETGKATKKGRDFQSARLRGYAYGAFEGASEIATGEVLGKLFKGIDIVSGGYIGKMLLKAGDKIVTKMAGASIGRGIASFSKGVQRIAELRALNNPAVEYLEEGIQEWAESVFAQRESDTSEPVYVQNKFDEATGKIVQIPIEPGSDKEEQAQQMLKKYGKKSGYEIVGNRQLSVGEKTVRFGKKFFTWKQTSALAEGFALQYVLNIGGGAIHAVSTKESRGMIDRQLMAAGFDNAAMVRMTDKQKAKAHQRFYGDEANRKKFAELFKDAGEMLYQQAQHVEDAQRWTQGATSIKPNFTSDVAGEVEAGNNRIDDEESGISVQHEYVPDVGTRFLVEDRDGQLKPKMYDSAENAQKGAEYMSQLKQARDVDMTKRAEVVQQIANVYAPKRKIVLVTTDSDMSNAVRTEYEEEDLKFNPDKYKSGHKAITTPKGTIVFNLGAISNFDDAVATIKHETEHSVETEAGLTKLIGKETAKTAGPKLQKAGILPKGRKALVSFELGTVLIQKQYAEAGIDLSDADAISEYLASIAERATPVMRRKMGDSIANLIAGTTGKAGKPAKNMKEARRIAATILHSGKPADVIHYGDGGTDDGDSNAWAPPAPVVTEDPLVSTETGVEGAESEAKPDTTQTPEKSEEAQSGEPVVESEPGEAPKPKKESKEPVSDAKMLEVAEQMVEGLQEQKDMGVIDENGERMLVEQQAIIDKLTPKSEAATEKPTPAPKKEKKIFASQEEFNAYVEDIANDDEVRAWDENSYEIKPPKAEPKAESKAEPKAELKVESKAEQKVEPKAKAESKAEQNFSLDGGTEADIKADEKKLENQKKKADEKKKIKEGIMAPIKGDIGDATPPLPGMENEAPDDLALFNATSTKSNSTEDGATTRKQVKSQEPSDAQKKAGNYPKLHIKRDGMDISIENPVGSTRSGTDSDGKEWSQKMKADYGYIKGTVGYDKDHVDVFIKPHSEKNESDLVYVVNQKNPKTGKFDEHKVMIGYTSLFGAREGYLANYEPGWKGLGSITRMTMEQFKAWAYDKGKNGPASGPLKFIDTPKSNADVSKPVKTDSTPVLAVRGAMVDIGRDWRRGFYVEVVGMKDHTKTGKRLYMSSSTTGAGKYFVPYKHKNVVYNGMAALVRVKGKSDRIVKSVIIGGGAMPAGAEDKTVAEWEAYNQAIANGKAPAVEAPAKPNAPSAATQEEAPKAPKLTIAELNKLPIAELTQEQFNRRYRENIKALLKYTPEQIGVGEYASKLADLEEAHPKWAAEADAAMETEGIVKPAKKLKFKSMAEMEQYAHDNPDESRLWDENSFEIVGGEEKPAEKEQDIQKEKEQAAVKDEKPVFVPPKRKLGQPKRKYDREVAKAKAEWEAQQKEEVGSPAEDSGKESGNKEEVPPDKKESEEAFEAELNEDTQSRVQKIADPTYTDAPALAAMDVTIGPYKEQKALKIRTADSMERQAYSTPPPLAAIGAAAAANAVTIVEPTAGNGGLIAPLRLDIAPKAPDPKDWGRDTVIPAAGAKPVVLANELDPARAGRLDAFLMGAMGQSTGATVGDYAAPAYQKAVADAAKKGKRAFLMNPPFGKTTNRGFKLEHDIALRTLESAKPGDSLFFIGAAPARNVMKMIPGVLAGKYTTGTFAKFHAELNNRGWKPRIHFIADGQLYKKMGAAFPVEVILMEKTDGKELYQHMPMRDLPARYSSWEQIRAAVEEMYSVPTKAVDLFGEQLEADPTKAEKARAEAKANAEASSDKVNAARIPEPPRYRLNTPAFNAWFGKSKVVDNNGDPLVVYHGTSGGDFNIFDIGKIGTLGFHFGTKEQANNVKSWEPVERGHRPRRIVPVYLSIQNPLRTEDMGFGSPSMTIRDLSPLAAKRAYGDKQPFDIFSKEEAESLIAKMGDNSYPSPSHLHQIAKEALQAKGYDGIVYGNTSEGRGDSYIAFSPNQIKSAIGNNGKYSGTNDDIRYRLSRDIELGLISPETDSPVSPFMVKNVFGKQWAQEFGGKARNPDQLAKMLIALPEKLQEVRVKTADAIASYLVSNSEFSFQTLPNYRSMSTPLREAYGARWHQEVETDIEATDGRAQVEYVPLSDQPVVSPMMMPVELAGGMMRALDAFAERHPEGVDAYVAGKMGWTLEEVADGRLDGAQLDAVALAIEKIEDGTGFIVGSQTGAGKGRVMAAVMDYHMKKGITPIFITAKAKLFTDMWRDLSAIGAEERTTPLVYNNYVKPKDVDDDNDDAFIMPQFFTPARRNSAILEGKMPKTANALFLTYSQIRSHTKQTERKIDMIMRMLSSGKASLVLDEAHKAAGATSNSGQVIRDMVDASGPGVVFSSATFAKRGENMILYKRAGYRKFFNNDDEMTAALNVGGVPFQQFLASQLTENGFYIRHELDYTGISFKQLTTTDTRGTPRERTILANHEEHIADNFNAVVRGVMRFGALVQAINKGLADGQPHAIMDGATFMNSLHNTSAFIYTALKAETVAKAAVQSLREGKSPVITLYNTNQATLDAIGVGEQADVGFYLLRIAKRAMALNMPGGSVSILTPEGYNRLVHFVKEENAEILRATAEDLMKQAESVADFLRDKDLPASPIDKVREVVEAAGYNFLEVTGRQRMVRNGKIVNRTKPNVDTVVNKYNSSLDENGKPNSVILLNSAGSTGLSIHASPRFKNQAQRVMFTLQPAWDINEMMQTFGRINRKDQDVDNKPIYYLVFTSAAGEQRNAAILMAKLRSLSANTSGVSKAGYGENGADADALDFMNSFGDRALRELTEEHNPTVATINAIRNARTIRKATSISQFLPVREQEQFISQIQAKVAALQENARESGLHDLEAADIGRVPLSAEQLRTGDSMRAYEVPIVAKSKILTAVEAATEAERWHEENPDIVETTNDAVQKAIAGTKFEWLQSKYTQARAAVQETVEAIGKVYTMRGYDGQRHMFIPIGLKLPANKRAQVASDWWVKVSFNTIRGVTSIPLTIFRDRMPTDRHNMSNRSAYNNTLTRKDDRTIIAGDVAQALIGNIVSSGGTGTEQIVRATPENSNFASFVLLMPRGINISNAKKIASSRKVRLTDVSTIRRDEQPIGIDAGRVLVDAYREDGEVEGAVFYFRKAMPRRAKSKDIKLADLMRGVGLPGLTHKTPNSRGYIQSNILSIKKANEVLAALGKVHPALSPTRVVTNEEAVEGGESPRYRIDDEPVLTNLDKYKSAYRMILDNGAIDGKLDPAAFDMTQAEAQSAMKAVEAENDPTIEPAGLAETLRYRLNDNLGMYSKIAENIGELNQRKFTPEQLLGKIRNTSGVKAEEIEDLGLEDWLKGVEGKVTKEQVLEFIKNNGPQLTEVVKGNNPIPDGWSVKKDATSNLYVVKNESGVTMAAGTSYNVAVATAMEGVSKETKYDSYQMQGNTSNYREVLLTLPVSLEGVDISQLPDGSWRVVSESGSASFGNTKEEAVAHYSAQQKGISGFSSAHWGEDNVLAHVRLNDRTSPKGEKVLFIEEIQSDWHQKGRKDGYGSGLRVVPSRKDASMFEIVDRNNDVVVTRGGMVAYGDESQAVAAMNEMRKAGVDQSVPNAPFKKSWPLLAFKRVLRMAAEESYDAIAWTPGEVQVDRYNLSKYVDKIEWTGHSERGATKLVTIQVRNARPIKLPINAQGVVVDGGGTEFDGKALAEVIGKDIAEKVVAETYGSLAGDNLKVGGDGMKGFYDQILPKSVDKYVKKLGSRVGTAELNTLTGTATAFNPDEQPTLDASYRKEVWNVPITDQLRGEALAGQPRYRLGDPVLIGAVRPQRELEEASHLPFPILTYIRAGSPIIIPPEAKNKGEYNWFTENGGYTAYNVAERSAFFEQAATGNIDTLAQTLGFDDVENFVEAFLTEVDQSRALLAAEQDAHQQRQELLNGLRKHFEGKTDVPIMLGLAINKVVENLPESYQDNVRKLLVEEGEEAARDYVLSRLLEQVVAEMERHYAFNEAVEFLSKSEKPAEIEDEGTFARPEKIDKEGNTADVFQQTEARLEIIAAILHEERPSKIERFSDKDATAYVKGLLDEMGDRIGKKWLRDEAEKLIADRLTASRDIALNKKENAVMLWYQVDLDKRRADAGRRAKFYLSEGDLTGLAEVEEEALQLHQKTIDYVNAKYTYGGLAGQAMQSLKARVNSNFDIVKIYAQAVADNGGFELTPEQFEELSARADRLEKAWSDYTDALGSPSDMPGLQDKIGKLEKEVEQLMTAQGELARQTGALSQKRDSLTAQRDELRKQVGDISEKRAQLKKTIHELEQELVVRHAFNQEVSELEAEVASLQHKLHLLDREYGGYNQGLLDSLNKQIDALNSDYAEAYSKHMQAQNDLQIAKDRLARVRQLIKRLKKSTAGKIARRKEVLKEAANLYGVFKEEMEKAQVARMATRWRGSNLAEKAWMGIGTTRDVSRALIAMADESVAGRQLAKLGLVHPILWARALRQSQQVIFRLRNEVDEHGNKLTWEQKSDRAAFEIDQALREHPLFDVLVRIGGLSWIDLTADPQSMDEQQIPVGELLRALATKSRMPGAKTTTGAVTTVLGVSNNHYAAMSNMMRFAAAAQLYGMLLKMNGGKTPSEADIRHVVGLVEIFGGRGDLNPKMAKGFLGIAKHFLFSARLTLANFQFFTNMLYMITPGSGRSAKIRAVMATEYLRLGATYALLTAVIRILSKMLSDDPDEQRFQFTTGHPSFLQFMHGQQRIDVTGGAAMTLRSMAGILGISDRVSTETGLVTGERGNVDSYATGHFLRSKLDPWMQMLATLATGKTFSGQAAGPRAKSYQPGYDRRYLNLFKPIAPVPLSVQTFASLLKGDEDQGIKPLRNPLTIAFAMLWETLGAQNSSLPTNPKLAEQVANGRPRMAEKLETLKRKQKRILKDKKKSPTFKELQAERVQRQIDRLR